MHNQTVAVALLRTVGALRADDPSVLEVKKKNDEKLKAFHQREKMRWVTEIVEVSAEVRLNKTVVELQETLEKSLSELRARRPPLAARRWLRNARPPLRTRMPRES